MAKDTQTQKKRSERTKKLKGKKGFLQNLSLITGLAREKVKERKRKKKKKLKQESWRFS